MKISMLLFKRMIVGFWAIWWILAFLTDFLGGLYQLDVLTEAWLPHANYPRARLLLQLLPRLSLHSDGGQE